MSEKCFTLDESRGFYETYGIYGVIPDARSTAFDMWRNFDDKNISDVHFYLRLNHSRFITSKLLWRPELMNEFQVIIVRNFCRVF